MIENPKPGMIVWEQLELDPDINFDSSEVSPSVIILNTSSMEDGGLRVLLLVDKLYDGRPYTSPLNPEKCFPTLEEAINDAKDRALVLSEKYKALAYDLSNIRIQEVKPT